MENYSAARADLLTNCVTPKGYSNMKDDDMPLINGLIIPVHIFIKKNNSLSTKSWGSAGSKQVGLFLWGLCALTCGILILLSLLQRHTQYLAYLAISISPWLLFSVALFLIEKAKAYTKHSKIQDEGVIARVDWLKHHTSTIFSRVFPSDKMGINGWLTEDGIYFNSGKHLDWSEFGAFSIDVEQNYIYLTKVVGRNLRSIIILLIFSVGILTGIFFGIHHAINGYQKYAFQSDVTALFLACLLNVVQLSFVVFGMREIFMKQSYSDKKLLAKYDESIAQQNELTYFLEKYLPLERRPVG